MSPPIALLVPSRGRPHNARALIESWQATTEGKSWLWFLIDEDDPTANAYSQLWSELNNGPSLQLGFWFGTPARLVEWTNVAATHFMGRHAILGSVGDDHRLSLGWESTILRAFDELGGTGIVYGDDGIRGEDCATAFFFSSNIVRTLGYMGPPTLEHLFVDDAAMALGRAAGCLRYVPELKIPHLHPIAHKAEWDDTYQRGNGGEVWAKDSAAFEAWKRDGLKDAAAKIKALRGTP